MNLKALETLITQAFGKSTASKGLAYWRQARARVLEVDEKQDVMQIRSMVRGSGFNFYEVQLSCALKNPEMMQGMCSSPMMDDCKHCAATAYTYFSSQPDQRRETSIDTWLTGLRKQRSQAEQTETEDLVVYLLSFAANKPLEVTPVKVRKLKKGLKRSQIMLLDALLKLRQVCCDPSLVKLDRARKVKESAKLDFLATTLPELVAEGRKILIFSQFFAVLDLIEPLLKKLSISYLRLTRATRKREEIVDKFQRGEAPIFLISLKASGVGLNLTAADTVIYYDPWLNPAAENQATDRAWRIGQDKPVFVYKLITKQTIEEKILALQAKKQQLTEGFFSEQEEGSLRIEAEELLALLEA